MNPVDYLTRGFGDYGAVPNAVADFCMGPQNLATPDWPLQYSTRWVAWRASNGIRILKNPPDDFIGTNSKAISLTSGTLSGLFDGDTSFTKLSMAFDQNGRAVIAVQRSGGIIELRNSAGGSFTWSGKSPLVFFNGELEYNTPDTDVICYYLPPEGDRILVRVQRDNYGIEHEMNAVLNTPLDRLTKVDAVEGRVVIWAMTGGATRSQVRQSVIKSQLHNLWPVPQSDEAAQSASFLIGEYVTLVVSTSAGEDAGTQSVSFLDGIYASTSLLIDELESALQSATFFEGSYALVIIPSSTPVEDAAQFISFFEGSYALVIIIASVVPLEDAAGQSTSFLSGLYEAA